MTDRDALRSVPSLLLRTGYVDAHATFGLLNLRRRDIAKRVEHLAPMTRAMVELWWLEHPVPYPSLAFVPELDALVTSGLLRRNADQVTATCIAMPMFGQVVLLPFPSNVGTIPYGLESFALAMRIGPPRRGRCLDLCSGSGIQSLRAAASGCDVVAIEIDPLAAEWARRNAIINSLDDRIDVRTGDLWDVADNEPYDYIVGNPPYGFIPPSLGALPVYAGGVDGLSVMRRVLEQLPRRLAADGVAHFVGGSMGTFDSVQIVDELRALYANERMRVVMTVTSRHHLTPGGALYAQLVAMFERTASPPRADAEELLREHLQSLGKTHFYHYLLVASHSDAPAFELTRYDTAGGTGHFL